MTALTQCKNILASSFCPLCILGAFHFSLVTFLRHYFTNSVSTTRTENVDYSSSYFLMKHHLADFIISDSAKINK